ncbi:Glycoside hydrolase superfamily [Phytophthora cactorum]|nr:Glycoside hydrolase superfamily [Phytophthora cactorum]
METSRLTESGGRDSAMYGPGGQRQTEMKLLAVEPDLGAAPERTQDYKGRIRTWPGLLLLLSIVAAAVALITINAIDVQDQTNINAQRFENASQSRRKIKDGLDDDNVIVSDDGQVGNPKKYPDMGCELPDYQSKKGQIYAVSKNGTEVPVGIKGLNWFGMETGLAIPFGLWENMDNGTSVYEVAAFLARNKFNSVRLPVCIKNILKDVAPDKSLINLNTNRAINITSYITTIQTIVEALGYRHITVMISLHTLDPKKSGGAWFSEDLGVSEDDFLDAVDILTKNLCKSRYWNILGLDLKNEPHECSWGGSDPDWQKGATLIGNRMLEGAPTGWRSSKSCLVSLRFRYSEAEGAREDYVELDDETLRNNVEKTMDKMFGYLIGADPNTAMVMGEFAGLYGKDAHPMKTTKRTTDFTIEVMLKAGYAGGYMWSLNPRAHLKMFPCFEVEVESDAGSDVVRPMPKSTSTAADSTDPPTNTFRNSEYTSGRASTYMEQGPGSESGRETMSQRQTEMKLMAMEPSDNRHQNECKTTKAGSGDDAATRQARYENRTEERRRINDGLTDDEVLISDDGQVGNPKKYPDMGCELPDYQSKDGQIFAVSKNGTEVPVGIKGVNWFGMETGLAIPFGLWENMDNGTSVYEVAAFLARNKFNSVRLPVCIKNILKNTPPQKTLINANTNRAINITTYMSTLQTIIQALGYRKITVMISLHTLDTKKSGGAWYSDELDVTEEQFLNAVDLLTKNLCTSKYWNILGLDLKNEPHECSWGGKAPDWQKGSTDTYYDWWGGGLENAGENTVELTTENKLVWAPHYYNTGVFPAWYLYASTGEKDASGAFKTYVELDDATLRRNVEITMDKMFGYLLGVDKNSAMVMGEFAGLYGKDAHPKKTTKRTTDFTIEIMLKAGYAGGYMWSLNPESAYQFNPADTYGTFTEGLLDDDWLTPNKAFMEGMAGMDDIKDLKMFPCFPQKASSTSSNFEQQTVPSAFGSTMEVSRPVVNAADDRQATASFSRSSEYSNGNFSAHLDSSQGPRLTEGGGAGGGHRQTMLKAADFDDLPPETTKDYKGRIRTWPGLLLLLLIIGGAVTIIVLQAKETSDLIQANRDNYEQQQADKRKIKDGKEDDQVLISDDGQVGNPKKYPDMGCELPDYQSKNGQIVAVSKNGTEVPVGIKGVNWFGMETGLAIPSDSGRTWTTALQFDRRSAGLPPHHSHDQPPHIGPKKSGGAWYSDELEVTEDDFLSAIDILTKNLCHSKYWNILGLDLKNEPHECSWGGDDPDWQKGATLIGNRMLEDCPNWLAFVEGIAGSGTISLNGESDRVYYDWWGGGMEKAGDYPITFDVENKLVWSPHYYNTGVSPAWYFYASGTQNAEGGMGDYKELDDDELKKNVEKTMDAMFGYLIGLDSNIAMVMGEFAGLYSKDAHPKLTTKRTTDFTIEVMLKAKYAGAYMWSLNPESAYQYNPADTYGTFTEGLLQDDWLTPNKRKGQHHRQLSIAVGRPPPPGSFGQTRFRFAYFATMRDHRASLVVERPGERLSTPMTPWQIGTEIVRNEFVPVARHTLPATVVYSDKDRFTQTYTADPSQNMRLIAKKSGESEDESDYKGQYRIWPGLLLLFVLVVGAMFLITKGAVDTYEARTARAMEYEQHVAGKRSIKDGKTDDNIIISDDGQVGNPKSYDTSVSKLPAGDIVFNLRLPVSVENLLNNNPPQKGVINLSSNRAINGTDFISTLQTLVKSLAYRNIGVLISMHRLTNKKSGATWFDEDLGVTQDDFLNAVDIVSSNLCGQDYWNVMGLDLKNEPEKATWGTGDDDDFVAGCEKIAKVMHGNCPQWLGFVEGVVSTHTVTIGGEELDYYDWWGGGLQKAGDTQPKFTVENKVVWAPHYYTTAVAPQRYFYGDGTTSDFSTRSSEADDEAHDGSDNPNADALQFGAAVDEHYWYQMSVDDLPVWGLVGKVMKPTDDVEYLKQFPVGTRVLYTHKKYSISHNGPSIIHVNLTYSDVLTSIASNKKVEFTYEVVWSETSIPFEDRFDRYLEDEFFEHQIHWFSIFNSFMMVIFLCGLVALILLRTLKNDYARFAEDDAEELMMDGKSSLLKDDANSGWKLLHGDVFRAPPYLLLFTALVGTGAQLLVLSVCLMLIAIGSSLYIEPGGIVSVGLTVYAFSSLANGYASGAFYHQFFYPRVSKDWIRAMCLSSALLPTVTFVSVFFINALAVFYGTTYAIPFVTIVQVVLVWFFVSCPLAVLGTILGRHGAAKAGFPCRVNKFPREVPEARCASIATSSVSEASARPAVQQPQVNGRRRINRID